MRVGELSRRSGVSVASIKYYLREGLLPPGERTGPNQAAYDENHVRRLRMVRALIDVGGLSVAATRSVLAAVDDPEVPLYEALGRAQATVMPGHAHDADPDDEARAGAEQAMADLVAERGWHVSPRDPGLAHRGRGARHVHPPRRRRPRPPVGALRRGHGGRRAAGGRRRRGPRRPGAHRRGRHRRHRAGRHPPGRVAAPRPAALLHPTARRSSGRRRRGLASPTVSSAHASRPETAYPSRIGVWWTSDSWTIGAATEVARDIERMGYGSLFYGEAYGKESLTQAGAFLNATERLVVGTGIANIHARDPIAAESGARTLTALHPGRFVLGLGISHGPLVERGRGGTYTKPLATTRDYLERMDAVPEQVEPGVRPVRLLAALGPEDDRAVRDGGRRRPPLPRAAAADRGDPRGARAGQVGRLRAGRVDHRGERGDGGGRAAPRPRAPRGVLGAAELPELVAAPGLRGVRPGPRRLRPARPRTRRDR